MNVKIRPVAEADRAAWDRLYAGYAEFYAVAQTAEMRDRVWGWLMDADHAVTGFVAEGPDGLVGLAHVRAFARPLAVATGGFMDDLFVAPEARGSGAADALIEAVRALGAAKGWSVVRWITADDNLRAQRVYDRMAQRTAWVTYDLAV